MIRPLLITFILVAFSGCKTVPPVTPQPTPKAEAPIHRRKSFVLTAEDFWRLELSEGKRFDASGLAWDRGQLLIVADAQSGLFRVELGTNHSARLQSVPIFSREQMQPFTMGRPGRFDLEGIAIDESNRIYVCEEATRSVFRWDALEQRVERLEIDWSPVRQYFSSNENSSFEGIAVGGGKLWLANERERPRLIELDLQSLKVGGDYAPEPSTWGIVLHYSDLCWFKGRLFLLLRHHRVILEINPLNHEVLAEYNFQAIEDAPEHFYQRLFPTGTMEGLAVDDNYFWLATDNNGMPRMRDPNDRRPTLFKCPRPR